jgi:hypothetical protein
MIFAQHFELPMALMAIPPFNQAIMCGVRVHDPEDTPTSPAVWHFMPLGMEGGPIMFPLSYDVEPTDLEDVYDALLRALPHAAERYRALTDLMTMQFHDISPEQITGEEPPRR